MKHLSNLSYVSQIDAAGRKTTDGREHFPQLAAVARPLVPSATLRATFVVSCRPLSFNVVKTMS